MQVHTEDSQFVSIVFAPALSSAIPFPPQRQSGLRQTPQPSGGAEHRQRLTARALTRTYTKTCADLPHSPHSLRPQRTVKTHQRLRFLRRAVRGNYL